MGKSKSAPEYNLGLFGNSIGGSKRLFNALNPNEKNNFILRIKYSHPRFANSESSQQSEAGIVCNGTTYYVSSAQLLAAQSQCNGNIPCMCNALGF
jgi:hypothetical protein